MPDAPLITPIFAVPSWLSWAVCPSRCPSLCPGLLRVLESPWIFFQIFKASKVLENRHGPWKSLNLYLKVLESAWIRFSKRQCIASSRWLLRPWNMPRMHCRPGLHLRPAGGAHDARLGTKNPTPSAPSVPQFSCLSLYILRMVLESPWFWFWQMGKNPVMPLLLLSLNKQWSCSDS